MMIKFLLTSISAGGSSVGKDFSRAGDVHFVHALLGVSTAFQYSPAEGSYIRTLVKMMDDLYGLSSIWLTALIFLRWKT